MTCTARLIDEAMDLPIEERIHLVDSLLLSLNPVDNDVEAAWAKVAERRLDDMLSGRVQGVPAERVFERAKKLVTQ